MLVLSRKQHEQILIGENIRVRVVSIRGNQVQLGFQAPPQVAISRAELSEPIRRPGGVAHSRGDRGETEMPNAPMDLADAAALAEMLWRLASQARRELSGAADRPGDDRTLKVRTLLRQIAQLRERFRERGPDHGLRRWLGSLQRRLEDIRLQRRLEDIQPPITI